MARPDILVVDDDEDARELLADLFRASGYTVESASDGDRALVMIHDAPPRLVLLDLQMPQRGGLEVLESLAHDPPDEPTTVIVMTAMPIEKAPDGARKLVRKPLEPAKLVRMVNAFLAA